MDGIIKKIFIIFFSISMLSCESLPQVGSPIHISTYLSYNIDTRASYSGDIDNNIERIDWEVGDVILISQEYNGEITNAEYRITSFEENGRKSQAQVEPIGEPLMYQGKGSYIYRGYYPADNGNLDDDTYSFTISENQSNDVRNNLFMIVSSYSVNDERVSLEFSPVVNTFSFTFNNNVSSLVLSSKESITGTFYTKDGKNFTYEPTGNTIVLEDVGKSATIFMMPHNYICGNITMNINNLRLYNFENKDYDYFNSCYKYNFQDISTKLSSVVSGAITALAHNHIPYINWQIEDGVIKGPYPDGTGWHEIPWEEIYEFIKDVEELNVDGTWEMTEIYPEDLNVFPSLKKININATNLVYAEISNPNITEISIFTQPHCTIDIHDCESLTKLELKSNNGIEDVTIRNNDMLEFFTIDYPHSELTVRCIDCDKLKGFSVNQDYGIRYHVEFSGCPKWEGYTMPNYSTEF